jgi:hypothetical protein
MPDTCRIGDRTFRGELGAVLAFIAEQTKLKVVIADDTSGDVLIRPLATGQGAHVVGSGHGFNGSVANDGLIDHAEIEMECGSRRLVWEEVIQAFGAFGDQGPAWSILTDANLDMQLRGGWFEAVVLRTLYSIPPGSTNERVNDEAERQIASVCGGGT